jgi:hypothetical protein
VIYATLLLLAITVPRGLVNWSRNFDPNPLQEMVFRFAQWVQMGCGSWAWTSPLQSRGLFLS